MPRIINLIAGYRRTGKDTLHRDLAGGFLTYVKNKHLPWCDFTWIPLWIMFVYQMITLSLWILLEKMRTMMHAEKVENVRWLVFSNRSNGVRAHQEHLLVTRDRQRAAFADSLKQDVHEQINKCARGSNHPELTDAWFEQNKEQKIKIGNITATPREMYISVGETAKRRDPIIWVRKCFDSFICKSENPCPNGDSEIVDITDWRFCCEQTYAMLYAPIYHIFTTRVFRVAVNIPDAPSERNLDCITTDLLLVPSYTEMILALIQWPQYSRHMCIGSLG